MPSVKKKHYARKGVKMISFIANNWGTIVVLAVLLLMVTAIVIKLRKDKKKGRTSCGCECSGCLSAGMCHKQK